MLREFDVVPEELHPRCEVQWAVLRYLLCRRETRQIEPVLPLDSPRWAEIHDAFGSAVMVPQLIRALPSGDESSLDELFNSICHQGSIYEASFAAVPHLVALARATSDLKLRAGVLYLVARIRVSSDDRSRRAVLSQERDWYEEAIPLGRDLALQSLSPSVEIELTRTFLQAAAALSGHVALGAMIDLFPGPDLYLECSQCDLEIFVTTANGALFTVGEDPFDHPDSPRFPMTRGPVLDSPYATEHRWLIEHATPEVLSSLGTEIHDLFGRARCPGCQRDFIFLDEYLAS
jgi:hypothetical protein